MWFHPVTCARLSAMLEIPKSRVGDAMGNDVHQTWVNNNYAMEGIVHERSGEGHIDYWGIEWRKDGDFNQITHFPLADASSEQVLGYQFPVACKEALLALMKPVVKDESYYLGVDVSPCVFEMYWRLRGMEKAMLDMVAEPELADTMLKRCADFASDLSEAALNRFPVDWLWTGDDVAGQRSMLMSPELWRERIKPHLARVVDIGVRRGLPVAYHSCGAVADIIPDLIEIGVDVLNPVQCNCPGMEPLELKARYGDVLAFMGGVDTQGLLPNGTALEVRKATEDLIAGMTAGDGGYILAASHTVPPETPDENLFAMYEAAGITREEIFDRAAAIRNNPRDGA
jgi:uroporphyrinogen decarboxylase